MEELIKNFSDLHPFWFYLIVASSAFIENIFPPFPSDMLIVAAGSYVTIGKASLFYSIVSATIGGTLGFVSMFLVGHWFGERILERGKIRFISLEYLHKAEAWFKKYGYALIIANRFLAGTRAVVSFFAGMSELILWKTIVLSFVSSLVWNSILLVAGKTLGDNWSDVMYFLEAYSTVVTIVLIIVAMLLVGRYFYRKSTNGIGRS